MSLILRLAKDGQVIWPYSFERLRQDEPWLSISVSPHAGEIASWLELTPPITIIEYQPTMRPDPTDPRTERIEEAEPVETPDGWFQSWSYRLATPDEVQAYDLAQMPLPRWGEFAMALILMPEVSAFLSELPLAVSQALSIALSDILKGANVDMFCQLLRRHRMPHELAVKVFDLAATHQLPPVFTNALK